MIEIRAKLAAAHRPEGPVAGQLKLPFDLRRNGRLRTRLESGEEVSVALPRGETLRGGDLLATADGRVIEVVAEPESVLHVECTTAAELARVAYRLGNRHVPVQVGDGFLRLAAEHDLGPLLERLGARVVRIEAPFDPDLEAPDAGHPTGHSHGGAHFHDHDHDHAHTHDHHHGGAHSSGHGHAHD